jgi:cyclopropane-fatty-acyl-phospholipid synthase
MGYATLLNQNSPAAPGDFLSFRIAGFLVNQLIQDAEVTIRCRTDGPVLTLGQKGYPRFAMVIDRPGTLWEIIRNPDPGLGETYMDGRWRLEEGDIGAFITMFAWGREKLYQGPAGIAARAIYSLTEPPDYNHDPRNSKKLVQHHYDIGNDLYALFLDRDMNYSCAFFETPEMSLEDAQRNKIRTAIQRLDIHTGMRVLDIGCGWGNACRVIAAETQAGEVNGITLAENQLGVAKHKATFLQNKPQYFLEDYREHAEKYAGMYDRILSIGMFEHVGHENNDAYFAAVNKLLAPGGRALIHSIVRSGKPGASNVGSPWLDKYIFPGGCIPEVQAMVDHGVAQGLELAHEPYIHPSFHYAETLRCWRKNFLANQHLLRGKYDARFQRMWIFYLAMCEAMFEGCGFRVAQVVFRRP